MAEIQLRRNAHAAIRDELELRGNRCCAIRGHGQASGLDENRFGNDLASEWKWR